MKIIQKYVSSAVQKRILIFVPTQDLVPTKGIYWYILKSLTTFFSYRQLQSKQPIMEKGP